MIKPSSQSKSIQHVNLHVPSVSTIAEVANKVLKLTPCTWQLQVCRSLLSPKQHIVVSTAPTGGGKTLTFWLPMLFETGITFVIVPLKDLGNQISQVAALHGFTSFNATSESLQEHGVFKVSLVDVLRTKPLAHSADLEDRRPSFPCRLYLSGAHGR